MSALSDYYDLLMPELPGITTALLDQHLREVARDFCGKTSAWREDLTAIDLVADQAAYSVAVPTDSALVRVVSLTAADELLWLDREAKEDDEQPTYRPEEPPFSLSDDLGTLTLSTDDVPTESLAAGLVIKAALKPSTTAATLPDFLRTQYSEAMRFGVLSRLMGMGKKPWSDRPLAGVYAQMWQQKLNFAGYQAQVGNTRQVLRVRKWG
jgi:hypothetical protein